MSRSYKKTPILKDGGRSSKWSKRYSNKILRRKTRDLLAHEDYDALPLKKYEGLNTWDVNDHISRWTLAEALYWRTARHAYWSWNRTETEEECIADWKKWYYYK